MKLNGGYGIYLCAISLFFYINFVVSSEKICYNIPNIMDCDKYNRRGVYGLKEKITKSYI